MAALVARYRKAEHRCTLARAGDGTLRFVLADGRSFRSPSAAGSAVMGGSACNGWRFWTPAYPNGVSPLAPATLTIPGADGAAETPPSAATAPRARSTRSAATPRAPRAPKVLRRVPNQRGVPDGQTRWFCSACMDGFLVPFGTTPEQCPQGHSAA